MTSDSVVLDIGAGTGIWSIVAAKLGARKVVAVDMDELLIGVIRTLAREHGVADRIETVCGNSFQLELGREFDVIVSETIGYLGYDEFIVEIMADARSRFLRDGGRIIPETVGLYSAAGKLKVRNEPVPTGMPIEFQELERLNRHSPRVLKRPRDIQLLTNPACLVKTDLRKQNDRPSLQNLNGSWEIDDACEINCFAVWVESRLVPGVNLSTRRTTSWLPNIYRIDPPAKQFDRVEFELSLTSASNYWTAIFSEGETREVHSYSPEYAATEMLAAARNPGVEMSNGPNVFNASRPLEIRLLPATDEDENFLCEVYSSTRREEVAAFGWDPVQQELFLTMQFSMQLRSYKMQYPDAEHNIITYGGQPAGRLIVNRDSSIAITDIALLPEFRRKGIATHLITQLQKEAAESDKKVELSVDKTNAPAMELYRRLGFITTSESEFSFRMEWSRDNANHNVAK